VRRPGPGYGEHQRDAAQYRQIAELCAAPGMDQAPVEAWIEVGRPPRYAKVCGDNIVSYARPANARLLTSITAIRASFPSSV
jgi:hypothetical protein